MTISDDILKQISERFGGSIDITARSYCINTSNPMIWFIIKRESENSGSHYVTFNGRGGSMGTTWPCSVFETYTELRYHIEQLFINAMIK
jgi:hypothetical protein